MNKFIVVGLAVALIGLASLYFLTSSTPFDEEIAPVLNAEQNNITTEAIEEKNTTVKIPPVEEPVEIIPASDSNIVIGTLTYTRNNSIDPIKKRFGVTLKYSTEPQCNVLTNKDVFAILTGDGTEYRADCKGVEDHIYKEPGTYIASYLKNEVEIASVNVEIK